MTELPTPPTIPRGMAMFLKIGFAIGGLLLVVALVLTVREAAFIARSTSATATVSRIDREWMSGGSTYRSSSRGNWGYRLVASFPADGRTIEIRSPSTVSATGYRVGDTIGVEYPPGRPDQAQLVRFVDRWMLPLILGIIGGAFIAIGAFALWLTRLPGARITSNGLGFSVRSPVYAVDADLRKPSRPSAPKSAAKRTAWLVAVVLVVGIAIGFLIARRGHEQGSTRTSAVPGDTSSTPDPSAPATPGYPSKLLVKAPPMPDDQTDPTTSWTDPQNGGATAQNLTMAARAFLARPNQDAAMQSALRTKAARLGLACPGTMFRPGDTTLLPAPAPIFATDGTMRQGLVRQRFTGWAVRSRRRNSTSGSSLRATARRSRRSQAIPARPARTRY